MNTKANRSVRAARQTPWTQDDEKWLVELGIAYDQETCGPVITEAND